MVDCLTPLQIAESLSGNNGEVVRMLRKAMTSPESFVDDKDSDSEASISSADEDESSQGANDIMDTDSD